MALANHRQRVCPARPKRWDTCPLALRRPRPPNDGTVAVSRTVSHCTGSNCKMTRDTATTQHRGQLRTLTLLLGAKHGCGGLHVPTHNATEPATRSARPGPWGFGSRECVASPTRSAIGGTQNQRVQEGIRASVGTCDPNQTLALGSTCCAILSRASQMTGRLPARFQILVFT